MCLIIEYSPVIPIPPKICLHHNFIYDTEKYAFRYDAPWHLSNTIKYLIKCGCKNSFSLTTTQQYPLSFSLLKFEISFSKDLVVAIDFLIFKESKSKFDIPFNSCWIFNSTIDKFDLTHWAACMMKNPNASSVEAAWQWIAPTLRIAELGINSMLKSY